MSFETDNAKQSLRSQLRHWHAQGDVAGDRRDWDGATESWEKIEELEARLRHIEEVEHQMNQPKDATQTQAQDLIAGLPTAAWIMFEDGITDAEVLQRLLSKDLLREGAPIYGVITAVGPPHVVVITGAGESGKALAEWIMGCRRYFEAQRDSAPKQETMELK